MAGESSAGGSTVAELTQDPAPPFDVLADVWRTIEVGMVLIASDERILKANPRAQHLFGPTLRVGSRLCDLEGELIQAQELIPFRPGQRADLDEVAGPRSGRVELIFRPMGSAPRRLVASIRPIEVTDRPQPASSRQLLLVAFQDVTESWTVTREHLDSVTRLELLNEALERRVAERTVLLEAQADQLRIANAELEAFSYGVSHDLRAPLRAMGGFSQVLLDDLEGQLSSESAQYLIRIRENALQMNEMIDALLALSRVQRRDVVHAVVDMHALALEVWASMDGLPGAQETMLTVGTLPEALGDPRLLRQIWANLLENAVKFTARQPSPTVEIGFTEAAEGITYWVRDNGVGFDMRSVDRLFQPFRRLHSVTDYPGTGIGLALVERIARRHGGWVRAEAIPGSGATITFCLNVLRAGVSD